VDGLVRAPLSKVTKLLAEANRSDSIHCRGMKAMNSLIEKPNTANAPGDLYERQFMQVTFQKGFPREVGINGCRVEDVIDLAIDRLEAYQRGPLACVENEIALNNLRSAVRAVYGRRRRREEQGVLNTMTQHVYDRTEDEHEDFSATGS
jgi:hypothetical protein